MNLLDTNIEVLNFRFAGWWFDAAAVNNFLQYLPFRLKFGRHLDLGVRYNPSKSRLVVKNFTGAGIFI